MVSSSILEFGVSFGNTVADVAQDNEQYCYIIPCQVCTLVPKSRRLFKSYKAFSDW